MTDNERKIYALQERIMVLGNELVTCLKGSLSDQNAGFLASYFEANEYGEALDLLDFIIDQEGLGVPPEGERILLEIRNAKSEIGRLFHQ